MVRTSAISSVYSQNHYIFFLCMPIEWDVKLVPTYRPAIMHRIHKSRKLITSSPYCTSHGNIFCQGWRPLADRRWIAKPARAPPPNSVTFDGNSVYKISARASDEKRYQTALCKPRWCRRSENGHIVISRHSCSAHWFAFSFIVLFLTQQWRWPPCLAILCLPLLQDTFVTYFSDLCDIDVAEHDIRSHSVPCPGVQEHFGWV